METEPLKPDMNKVESRAIELQTEVTDLETRLEAANNIIKYPTDAQERQEAIIVKEILERQLLEARVGLEEMKSYLD